MPVNLGITRGQVPLCLNIPIDINLDFGESGKRSKRKLPVLADYTQLLVTELGFVYNMTILWLERNVSRRTAWGSWLSTSDPWVNTAAEAVLVVSKQRRKRDGDGRTSEISKEDFMDWTLGVWDFPGESAGVHAIKSEIDPTPFSVTKPNRPLDRARNSEQTPKTPL